jgi:hypothetical protein
MAKNYVEVRLESPHFKCDNIRVHRSTLIETQEVFLNLSAPDIIKQKLELVGLTGEDVEMCSKKKLIPRPPAPAVKSKLYGAFGPNKK